MILESGNYRVNIDGKWSLEDIYTFPRTYEQCYFMYLAMLPDEELNEDDRIFRAYNAFPWQGGYSAVNFYNQLKWAVPKQRRPQITRIEYASPGIIELFLLVAIASAIGKIVKIVCSGARDINGTYNTIYRDLQERKLLKIKTEAEIHRLNGEELHVVESYVETMASILNVDKNILNERTGSPLKSLKILLSLYRRVRKLAELESEGKIKL